MATSVYTYEGVAYDRVAAALARPHPRLAARRAADPRARSLAGTPYSITDLEAALLKRSAFSAVGAPVGINDLGQIVYYDDCYCFGGEDFSNGNAGLTIDASGNYFGFLGWLCCELGESTAVPYAINDSGNSSGSYTQQEGSTPHTYFVVWTLSGGFLNADSSEYSSNESVALALNDGNLAVGQVTYANGSGTYAAVFPLGYGYVDSLAPPKNTSWIGTATGISKYGIIVGYGIFRNEAVGRAVRFFQNGYAAVLPVGAPGVSTSAQAINVHGDIVGNAGGQAYLYKNNRVTYLPRPPGETAGNAVALAVNANDEVVGNIYTGPNTSTAFLYVDGASYDLTSLLSPQSGWQIQTAVGINDTGQIVGAGYSTNESVGGSYSMQPKLPVAKSAAVHRREF